VTFRAGGSLSGFDFGFAFDLTFGFRCDFAFVFFNSFGFCGDLIFGFVKFVFFRVRALFAGFDFFFFFPFFFLFVDLLDFAARGDLSFFNFNRFDRRLEFAALGLRFLFREFFFDFFCKFFDRRFSADLLFDLVLDRLHFVDFRLVFFDFRLFSFVCFFVFIFNVNRNFVCVMQLRFFRLGFLLRGFAMRTVRVILPKPAISI